MMQGIDAYGATARRRAPFRPFKDSPVRETEWSRGARQPTLDAYPKRGVWRVVTIVTRDGTKMQFSICDSCGHWNGNKVKPRCSCLVAACPCSTGAVAAPQPVAVRRVARPRVVAAPAAERSRQPDTAPVARGKYGIRSAAAILDDVHRAGRE